MKAGAAMAEERRSKLRGKDGEFRGGGGVSCGEEGLNEREVGGRYLAAS